MTLIFATTNKFKAQELKKYLPQSVDMKTLADYDNIVDIEETGKTFKENALLKARNVYDQLHETIITEDSGIVINGLHGLHKGIYNGNDSVDLPGIYSARYSSMVLNDDTFNHDFDKNNELVLKELSDNKDRSAYMVSTICLYDGKTPVYFVGIMNGVISKEVKGTNGFAYDKIFYPVMPDNSVSTKTYAEMTDNDKNALSHRIQAFKSLQAYLADKEDK